MAQQISTPKSAPSKRRWLPIALITLGLVLAAVVPAAWALIAKPWERPSTLTEQGAVGDKGAPGNTWSDTTTLAPAVSLTFGSTGLPYADRSGLGAGGGGQAPVPSPTAVPVAASSLDTAQRQIIDQASLSLEVTDAQAVIAQVQAIAQSKGGYVEQLTSSTSTAGGTGKQYATITIRVPQAEFYNTLDLLRPLGKVKDQNLGSQDVTDQFIDLQARLTSSQQEEASLLSLMGKAQQVSDVLTIERELARVRADIERYQGQLNFLQHRIDLATITVSLFPPAAKASQPPSGSLTVEVKKPSSSADAVKALASNLKGQIDSLSISVKNGKTRADISLHVFTKDFNQAVGSIEGEGKTLSKDLREGTGPADATPADQPDAPITITFVEPEKGALARALTIALWVGSGALAVGVGLLFYGVYRWGKKRGQAAGQKTA